MKIEMPKQMLKASNGFHYVLLLIHTYMVQTNRRIGQSMGTTSYVDTKVDEHWAVSKKFRICEVMYLNSTEYTRLGAK